MLHYMCICSTWHRSVGRVQNPGKRAQICERQKKLVEFIIKNLTLCETNQESERKSVWEHSEVVCEQAHLWVTRASGEEQRRSLVSRLRRSISYSRLRRATWACSQANSDGTQVILAHSKVLVELLSNLSEVNNERKQLLYQRRKLEGRVRVMFAIDSSVASHFAR